MDKHEKIKLLTKQVLSFSEKNNVRIELKVGKRFSIAKSGKVFTLTLEEKELLASDIDELNWFVESNLNLILSGRFPPLKYQLLLFSVAFVFMIINKAIIRSFHFVSPEAENITALVFTFFIVNALMNYWSRKKVLESDDKANKVYYNGASKFLNRKFSEDSNLVLLMASPFLYNFTYVFLSYPSYFKRFQNMMTNSSDMT